MSLSVVGDIGIGWCPQPSGQGSSFGFTDGLSWGGWCVCVFVVVGLCECLMQGRFQPLCGCWLGSPVVPQGTLGGGLSVVLIGLWTVFFFIFIF